MVAYGRTMHVGGLSIHLSVSAGSHVHVSVQDDKSYDGRKPRTASTALLRGVGGRCLTVRVHYLHHTAHRSALFVGVAFASVIHKQGRAKLAWATKALTELKVCIARLVLCCASPSCAWDVRRLTLRLTSSASGPSTGCSSGCFLWVDRSIDRYIDA